MILVVTVYTTGPGCQACRMTKKRLDQNGITYTEVPIHDDDREAIDYLGFRTAPVVCASTPTVETSWDGYRPDRIDALRGVA